MRTLGRLVAASLAMLIVIALPLAPASALLASWQPANLLVFELDKTEASRDETVVATYRLDRPARSVALVAMTLDGSPAGFRLPQRVRSMPSREAGVISFAVPAEAGALSPLVLMLRVDGRLRGAQRLIVRCDHPWFFAPRVEGCPFAPVRATPAAMQRFEHGVMIWLAEMDSIYVLRADGARLERYDDAFVEGGREPALGIQPPPGRFAPVRGFGLVWHTMDAVRSDLGWALEPEQGYVACYGYAHIGGKAMRAYVTTPDGRLLEFEIYYAPVRWRELRTIAGQSVTVIGCDGRTIGH